MVVERDIGGIADQDAGARQYRIIPHRAAGDFDDGVGQIDAGASAVAGDVHQQGIVGERQGRAKTFQGKVPEIGDGAAVDRQRVIGADAPLDGVALTEQVPRDIGRNVDGVVGGPGAEHDAGAPELGVGHDGRVRGAAAAPAADVEGPDVAHDAAGRATIHPEQFVAVGPGIAGRSEVDGAVVEQIGAVGQDKRIAKRRTGIAGAAHI